MKTLNFFILVVRLEALALSPSARRKSNHISFFKNEEGVRVEDREGMCNVVKEYFSRIFAEPETDRASNMTVSPRLVSRIKM